MQVRVSMETESGAGARLPQKRSLGEAKPCQVNGAESTVSSSSAENRTHWLRALPSGSPQPLAAHTGAWRPAFPSGDGGRSETGKAGKCQPGGRPEQQAVGFSCAVCNLSCPVPAAGRGRSNPRYACLCVSRVRAPPGGPLASGPKPHGHCS